MSRDLYSRELPRFAIVEVRDARDGPEITFRNAADEFAPLATEFAKWYANRKDFYLIELHIHGKGGK